MRRAFFVPFCLLFLPGSISAQSNGPSTVTGPTALALAAIVGENSPSVSASDKIVLAGLFEAQLNFTFPANQRISVVADAVVCRVSNVDLTARSCDLTFGAAKSTLTGRKANELNAMAVVAGVPSDGAAGSIFESLAHLACTIDPNEIKQRDGGGASCTFANGQ